MNDEQSKPFNAFIKDVEILKRETQKILDECKGIPGVNLHAMVTGNCGAAEIWISPYAPGISALKLYYDHNAEDMCVRHRTDRYYHLNTQAGEQLVKDVIAEWRTIRADDHKKL